MNLIRGDINNLEQKAVIYATLREYEGTGPDAEERREAYKELGIIAMYITNDPAEYIKMRGGPDGAADAAKKLLSQIEELGKKHGTKIESVFVMGTTFDSLEEIMALPESQAKEIINAGQFSHPVRCMQAVELEVKKYEILLEDQYERKGKKPNKHPDYSKSKITTQFKDIPSTEMQTYLMNEYVIPMIDAKKESVDSIFKELKNRFLTFSIDTPADRDALAICEEIDRKDKKTNHDLIHAYVSRIVSVRGEDYETAAKWTRKINEIKIREPRS